MPGRVTASADARLSLWQRGAVPKVRAPVRVSDEGGDGGVQDAGADRMTRRQRIAFENPSTRAVDTMGDEFREIGTGLSSILTVNK